MEELNILLIGQRLIIPPVVNINSVGYLLLYFQDLRIPTIEVFILGGDLHIVGVEEGGLLQPIPVLKQVLNTLSTDA